VTPPPRLVFFFATKSRPSFVKSTVWITTAASAAAQAMIAGCCCVVPPVKVALNVPAAKVTGRYDALLFWWPAAESSALTYCASPKYRAPAFSAGLTSAAWHWMRRASGPDHGGLPGGQGK
jgi:hypothetical protein